MPDTGRLTADEAGGLGVALNESDLLTVQVQAETARAMVALNVLTLPEHGPEPDDRRRRLYLSGVSRVAASYRGGRWDDSAAPVLPLELDGLPAVIASFVGHAIYGWEFVNRGDAPFEQWSGRLSLDAELDGTGTQTLDLFQEDGQRILDLRIWFETLTVTTADRQEIALADFIAGGVRWWDAMYAGDARTGGHGIVAAGP